jgi:hypothetical protein
LNAPNVNSAPEKAPIILPKTPLGTAKKGVSFPGEISLMQSALSLLHESPEKIEVIKMDESAIVAHVMNVATPCLVKVYSERLLGVNIG